MENDNLKANIITVNHTGNDVNDLENAIKIAKSGDIIDLGDHAYQISRYQIDLTKNITLLGNGVSTIFNGTGGTATSGSILYVDYSGRGSTIKGIIFNNTQAKTNYTGADTLNGWALDIYSSKDILVENCSFINFNRAVNIEYGTDITVKNCYLNGTATRITNGNGKEYGSKLISVSYSSNVEITNSVFNGTVLEAIVIDGSMNTYVTDNSFYDNAYSIDLDSLYSDMTFVLRNKFYNCGHFINQQENINFSNLPVIKKSYDGDIYVNYNEFHVNDGNLLILAEANSNNSWIDVKGNTVKKIDEGVDSSTVTFVQILNVTKNLVNIGTVDIASNNLLSNMESLVIVDYIWYAEDGDIKIPQVKDLLDMSFDAIFEDDPILIDFTLTDFNSNPLNGTINLSIGGKHFNVAIQDGSGSIQINESFVPGNYPIIAKFNGDKGVTIVYDILTVYSRDIFENLQNIIDNADEGSVIYLNKSYMSLGTAIRINKTLTLIGNGEIILDSKGLSQVFIITASNVVLDNLKMLNGKKAVYGGAVWVDADNCTISNCKFINNVAMAAGAVAWDGANGRLINSSFTNNTANYGSGGAVSWSGFNGLIENCSFLNSYGSSGGGIAWNGHNGTVSKCAFESGRAYDMDGGAILWGGNNGTLLDSSFTNNFAYFYGGAIRWNGHNGNISNSIFISNFASNQEECGAGAVYWLGSNGVVSNSNFSNNYVKTNMSSEIIFAGAIGWEGSNGSVINSSFVNNTIYADPEMETIYGGAIYWNGTKPLIVLSNFTNNTSPYDKGGAVFIASDDAIMRQCVFRDNEAFFGGAVYWMAVNGILSDSEFISNQAYEGSALYWEEDDGAAYNCTFIANNASYGTVSWDGDNGILNRSVFINNTADNVSALYWYGYYGIIVNSIFDDASGSQILMTGFHPPSFENNFWGLNYNDADEIKASEIISANRIISAPNNWLKLEIRGIDNIVEKGVYEYVLHFVSNDGTDFTEIMPDYNLIVKSNINNILNKTLYDENMDDLFSTDESSSSYVLSNQSAIVYYLAKLRANDLLSVYNNKNQLLTSKDINTDLPEMNTHIIFENNTEIYVNDTVNLIFNVLDEDNDLVKPGSINISIDDVTLDDFEFDRGIISFNKVFDLAGNHSILIKYIGENIYQNSTLEMELHVNKMLKTAQYLQELIDSQQEGSILDLGPYTYDNISNINITKNITIVGNNTSIISAGDGNPIFNVISLSEGGPEEFNIEGIEFKLKNGDVLVNLNADNGTDSMAIDNAKIGIAGNVISTFNDDVVRESITVLKINSQRGILSPTKEINITGNEIDDGIKSFAFNVNTSSSEDGNNINIPSGGNLPIDQGVVNRTGTKFAFSNMKTTAINSAVDGKKGAYFSFTLKDSKNNLLANKKVLVVIGSKIYTLTTNSKGVARIQLNYAKAGKYALTMAYIGDDDYLGSFAAAKITVVKQKPKLKASAKKFKVKSKTKKLKATLKTSRGKVLKNKKVKFTKKGKTYTGTTNSKGVAKVKVSLKKKGKYTCKIKSVADKTYKSVTKKIKIRIV